MNIWPFKKKGTEKPGELTKEEWLRDAMPLIEVAHVQDRITHYQEAFDALTWSTENRTHDLIGMEPDKQVTEHRFVLDLNQIDPTRQATVRNAYAMSSGSSLSIFRAVICKPKDGILRTSWGKFQ